MFLGARFLNTRSDWRPDNRIDRYDRDLDGYPDLIRYWMNNWDINNTWNIKNGARQIFGIAFDIVDYDYSSDSMGTRDPFDPNSNNTYFDTFTDVVVGVNESAIGTGDYYIEPRVPDNYTFTPVQNILVTYEKIHFVGDRTPNGLPLADSRNGDMNWGDTEFPVIIQDFVSVPLVFSAECRKYYTPNMWPWAEVDITQTILTGKVRALWWFDSDGDGVFETAFAKYWRYDDICGVGFDYLEDYDNDTKELIKNVDTFWDIGSNYWELFNRNFLDSMVSSVVGGAISTGFSIVAGVLGLFAGRSYYEVTRDVAKAVAIAGIDANKGLNFGISLLSHTMQFSTAMWQRLYDLLFQRRYADVMDLIGDKKNIGYDMGGGWDWRYHHSVGSGMALGTSELPLGQFVDRDDYDQTFSVDGKVGPFLLDVQQALGKHKTIPGFSLNYRSLSMYKNRWIGIVTGITVITLMWVKAAIDVAIELAKTALQWFNPEAWVRFGIFTFFAFALPALMNTAYIVSEANYLKIYPSYGNRADDGGTPRYYQHVATPNKQQQTNLAAKQFWQGVSRQITDCMLTTLLGTLWNWVPYGRLIVLGMGVVAGVVDAFVYDPLNPIRQDEVSYRNVEYLSQVDVQNIVYCNATVALFTYIEGCGMHVPSLFDTPEDNYTTGQYYSQLAAADAAVGTRFKQFYTDHPPHLEYLIPSPNDLVYNSEAWIGVLLTGSRNLATSSWVAYERSYGGDANQRRATDRIAQELAGYPNFVIPQLRAAILNARGKTITELAQAQTIPVPVRPGASFSTNLAEVLYSSGEELFFLEGLKTSDRMAWLNLKWTRLVSLAALNHLRRLDKPGNLDMILSRSPTQILNQLLDQISIDKSIIGQHQNPLYMSAPWLYSLWFNGVKAAHASDPTFVDYDYVKLTALAVQAETAKIFLNKTYSTLVNRTQYAEIPAGGDSTYADVMAAEATVALFKNVCLNLSSFVTAAPETYAPFELVPVHQKGFSYYSAMPHSFPAPALHSPAAGTKINSKGWVPIGYEQGPTQMLMRYVDYAIMREMWMLKDIQGWAEMTATIISTAISTAAMVGIQAKMGKIEEFNQQRLTTGGKFLFVLNRIAKEAFEETVSEPIVGEWLLTMLSGIKSGAGQQVDSDLRFSDVKAMRGAIEMALEARALMGTAVKVAFMAQVKAAVATLHNEAGWQQLRAAMSATQTAWQETQQAGESWAAGAKQAFRTFLQVLLGGPEALAQRAPRVFDQAAATQVPGARGAAGETRSISFMVDGHRIPLVVKDDMNIEQIRAEIAAMYQARGLTAIALEDAPRFLGQNIKNDPNMQAAVSATGTLRFSSRGWFQTENGQWAYFPNVIDATTPGFNDPSKTLADLMRDTWVWNIVKYFGLTQEAAEQWVAENVNVQAVMDQYLFVDSGGATFVRGDPRNLVPKGWITIAALTEITGERAALSSLDAVRVELYINEVRQQSIATGVPITLRQALQGDIAKNLPGVRQMLRVLDGYGLSVEGYDQFGTRYPASILIDMPLEQLGISGLSFRIFDPPSQLNSWEGINDADQSYLMFSVERSIREAFRAFSKNMEIENDDVKKINNNLQIAMKNFKQLINDLIPLLPFSKSLSGITTLLSERLGPYAYPYAGVNKDVSSAIEHILENQKFSITPQMIEEFISTYVSELLKRRTSPFQSALEVSERIKGICSNIINVQGQLVEIVVQNIIRNGLATLIPGSQIKSVTYMPSSTLTDLFPDYVGEESKSEIDNLIYIETTKGEKYLFFIEVKSSQGDYSDIGKLFRQQGELGKIRRILDGPYFRDHGIQPITIGIMGGLGSNFDIPAADLSEEIEDNLAGYFIDRLEFWNEFYYFD